MDPRPGPPARRLRVAVLTAGRGWHAAELERALVARGHECRLLTVTRLTARVSPGVSVSAAGADLGAHDAVLVRAVPRGSLEQVVFRMDVLHVLEAAGVRVVNPPAAIERTVDKLWTSGLLAEAGVATPRTIACERQKDALAAFAALGGDVILKPLFGSMGLGMTRLEDADVAYRVFRALELERAVYYLQETLPHAGRDIRAFVLGGRVLAAMERVASGWRTNLARGGRPRPAALTAEQQALCLRAAAAVGADYAGVDLLPGSGGPDHVLEVNGIPAWEGLQAATGVDVAGELVAHLEQVGAPGRG